MVLNSPLARIITTVVFLAVTSVAYGKSEGNAMGPLKVCPDNPRYFMKPDGKAIVLAGSHTWSVLQNKIGRASCRERV